MGSSPLSRAEVAFSLRERSSILLPRGRVLWETPRLEGDAEDGPTQQHSDNSIHQPPRRNSPPTYCHGLAPLRNAAVPPGCGWTKPCWKEPCLGDEAGAGRASSSHTAPGTLHAPHQGSFPSRNQTRKQFCAGGPKIVTVSLVSATTKSYFPLRRWQWTYITRIITAAIFTAQKLAQQEFNSTKFHYSEKGSSVLTSENSSHKTHGKAQKGQKRQQPPGRGGRTSAGKLSPVTPTPLPRRAAPCRVLSCHPSCLPVPHTAFYPLHQSPNDLEVICGSELPTLMVL